MLALLNMLSHVVVRNCLEMLDLLFSHNCLKEFVHLFLLEFVAAEDAFFAQIYLKDFFMSFIFSARHF